MSELRTKVNELMAEVELFRTDLSGRIEKSLDTMESFVPMLVKELDIFTPEIVALQADVNSQISKVKGDLEEIIQDTK